MSLMEAFERMTPEQQADVRVLMRRYQKYVNTHAWMIVVHTVLLFPHDEQLRRLRWIECLLFRQNPHPAILMSWIKNAVCAV